MATLSEWLDGRTKSGVTLPLAKVNQYRALHELEPIQPERTRGAAGSQRNTRATSDTPATPELPVNLECIHRGEKVDRKANWPCSLDKTVYACALRGKCVKRAPSCASVAALEESGIVVCASCDMRERQE